MKLISENPQFSHALAHILQILDKIANSNTILCTLQHINLVYVFNYVISAEKVIAIFMLQM